MHKQRIIVLTVTVGVFVLALGFGCSNRARKEPDTAAHQYLSLIADKDYKRAYSCLSRQLQSFVGKEEFIAFSQQKMGDKVINIGDMVFISSNTTRAELSYEVSVQEEHGTNKIYLVKSDDGWRIAEIGPLVLRFHRHQEAKEFSKQMLVAEQILKVAPWAFEAQYLYGMSLLLVAFEGPKNILTNARIDQATKEARKIADTWPNKPEAHILLGGIQAERQWYARAEKSFSRAYKLSESQKDRTTAIIMRGKLRLKQGKLKGGLSDLRKAKEWEPDNPEILQLEHANRGLSRLLKKQ